ncbi:MAG: hypothetical protein ACLS3M_06320 [Collinsella sp.]
MGDVMGNLSGRRGKIEGMEDRKNSKLIRARCRWARCSVTLPTSLPDPGRASYTMQFDSMSPRPSPSWTRS